MNLTSYQAASSLNTPIFYRSANTFTHSYRGVSLSYRFPLFCEFVWHKNFRWKIGILTCIAEKQIIANCWAALKCSQTHVTPFIPAEIEVTSPRSYIKTSFFGSCLLFMSLGGLRANFDVGSMVWIFDEVRMHIFHSHSPL